MPTSYKIIARPWGVECRFCSQEAGRDDINDIVMLTTVDDDPAALIAARVAQVKAAADAPPPEEPNPSILLTVEEDKERLKWEAVAAIRGNASITATTFLATLSWQEAGIVQALIYSYAQMAAQKGMIPGVPETMDACWAVLVGIVMSMTDDQLREML